MKKSEILYLMTLFSLLAPCHSYSAMDGIKGEERTRFWKLNAAPWETVIKKGTALFMLIENAEKSYLCHWVNTELPDITEGPVGLRHMFTRSARYRDFRVSQLPRD